MQIQLNDISLCQIKKTNAMKFEIRIASNRIQWYFVLIARNGKTLCTSEMYNSKQAARKGIRAVKLSLVAPVYDMSI